MASIRKVALEITNDLHIVARPYIKHKTILWFLEKFGKPRMDKIISSEMKEEDLKKVLWLCKRKLDTIFKQLDTIEQITDPALNDPRMIKKVLEMCNRYNVECEASLERYMKCAFGICGNCTVDDKLVCIDGPIFNLKQLNRLKEFGRFARLKLGKKVTIEEYHNWRG